MSGFIDHEATGLVLNGHITVFSLAFYVDQSSYSTNNKAGL